jgi:hypothetical protein
MGMFADSNIEDSIKIRLRTIAQTVYLYVQKSQLRHFPVISADIWNAI